MDFARILDEWEKGKAQRKPQHSAAENEVVNEDEPDSGSRRVLKEWLDSEDNWKYYDKGSTEPKADPAVRRRVLRNMEPEAELDLHGLSLDESLVQLDRFLSEAVQRGLQKVLIIHGKGNHSKTGAVLPKAVLEYLQKSPVAGELGIPRREKGGSGATWVIIKNSD